jgi:hypothetical protein
MIGRILRGLVLLVVCFSVGTVLSAAVMGTYLGVKWNIDREKLSRMLAVAQGIDLAGTHPQPASPHDEPSPEQVSSEQIIEARAAKFRNLELREQALRSGLSQMQLDQTRLAADKAVLAKNREAFATQLADLEKRSTEAGWEQNRGSLSAIKAKQAKELLMAMLAKNEIQDVVALLAPMPDSKRAKIIGEFKTPEETQKIDEVLRLIRRGEPAAGAAANARQQLGASLPGKEGTNR